MMRPLTIAACLALTAAAVAANAAEQTTPATSTPPTTQAPAAAAGDADNGRVLSYTCQGCHGVEGYKNAYPNFHVPKIGGQSAQYITAALTEYRQGTRSHPTMQAQAQGFSEQDIADIAAYLSSLK